jgi:hypothetical protein
LRDSDSGRHRCRREIRTFLDPLPRGARTHSDSAPRWGPSGWWGSRSIAAVEEGDRRAGACRWGRAGGAGCLVLPPRRRKFVSKEMSRRRQGGGGREKGIGYGVLGWRGSDASSAAPHRTARRTRCPRHHQLDWRPNTTDK